MIEIHAHVGHAPRWASSSSSPVVEDAGFELIDPRAASSGCFAAEVVRVLTGDPPLSPVNAGELVAARWSRTP